MATILGGDLGEHPKLSASMGANIAVQVNLKNLALSLAG
jgi:hypothetical protein